MPPVAAAQPAKQYSIDNRVPDLLGQIHDYKEFRKKSNVDAARMQAAQRKRQWDSIYSRR